jgi:hypothetical protein
MISSHLYQGAMRESEMPSFRQGAGGREQGEGKLFCFGEIEYLLFRVLLAFYEPGRWIVDNSY